MNEFAPCIVGVTFVLCFKWFGVVEMFQHTAHWWRKREWVLLVPAALLSLATIGLAVLAAFLVAACLGMLGYELPLLEVIWYGFVFAASLYAPPFIKRVRHGEQVPRFYGAAWVEYHVPVVIAMPIPFNVIAGFLRRLWLRLKYAGVNLPSDSRAAYHLGRRDGYNQAIDDSTK